MKKIKITDELLAAFTEGNVSAEEAVAVIRAARKDPSIMSILELSGAIDEKVKPDFTEREKAKVIPMPQVSQLPMASLAATTASNDCVLACEKFVLKQRNHNTSDYNELKKEAEKRGWLKEGGTTLYNIGRILEEAKLSVVRRYDCKLEDLVNELNAGCSVIVAVDGNELLGNYEQEKIKDMAEGKTANHAIVVTGINEKEDYVEVHDPDSENSRDKYPLKQFMDAWDDSQYYMVSITERGKRPYTPHPHNIDDVKLPAGLEELTEAIAENAHEVWAEKRQAEGWTFGPERSDKLKQTPDMVPYCELTEQEKEYDRASAMRSIKLLYRLGYEIVKRK